MIGAREIFRTLNDFGVRYIVIGGLAQTLQGLAIKTDDVDICPDDDSENLARLAGALNDMHATEWDPHRGEEVQRDWNPEMLEVDRLWMLHTPYGPLDLLFAPVGTNGFTELSDDADVKGVAGMEIPVASIDSLIAMKGATGRPKDREHLLLLYRLRKLSQELDT